MGGNPSKSEPCLQMFGSNVTADAAAEASEAMVSVLHAIQDSIQPGSEPIEWRLSTRWICDGCELERPTADLPLGWINTDALDYCPACVAKREAS